MDAKEGPFRGDGWCPSASRRIRDGNGLPSPRSLPTAVWINPPKVPAVAEEVANPMTLESDAAAIGAVRGSCDAGRTFGYIEPSTTR